MQCMTKRVIQIILRQRRKSLNHRSRFALSKAGSLQTGVLTSVAAAMSTNKSPGVLKMGENPEKLSDSEWKKRLPEEHFYVLREHGTEAPFTGEYTFSKESGTYHCGCCGMQLFSSESKFESGCGWPSFSEALGRQGSDESKSNVVRREDKSFGMDRIEVLCKKCDVHLGHVFNDGPLPTGERFCINSVSLDFVPNKPKEKL